MKKVKLPKFKLESNITKAVYIKKKSNTAKV